MTCLTKPPFALHPDEAFVQALRTHTVGEVTVLLEQIQRWDETETYWRLSASGNRSQPLLLFYTTLDEGHDGFQNAMARFEDEAEEQRHTASALPMVQPLPPSSQQHPSTRRMLANPNYGMFA